MNSLKKNLHNITVISLVTVMAATMILLFIILLDSWSNVTKSLNSIHLYQFPLENTLPEENLVNGDLHLKYHQSFLTLLSVAIALFAAGLTFAAFYIQYIFNKKQHTDLERERCENQFFHLMDVYRDYCKSSHLSGVGNNKALFHYMFYEYKALFKILNDSLCKPDNMTNEEYAEKLNSCAFYIFLNGVSKNFKLNGISFCGVDKDDTNEMEDRKEKLKNTLLELQSGSENHSNENMRCPNIVYLNDYYGKKVKYFDGHRLRLIPYLKFLHLIIDFIAKHEEAQKERFDATKMLIAELSEHEIGLLYAYAHLETSEGLNIKNSNKDTCNILNKIFDSLPKDNARKFKFDDHSFLEIYK
ncbi:MAG: hypothetical protein K2N28_00885 [Muribaculaceae bacterium]|nr:hypothetical protein [Muribaculaceae bacterium]